MNQQPFDVPPHGRISNPAFTDISTAESTYRTALTRCFTTVEIVRLLSPDTTTLPLSTSPPVPPDGPLSFSPSVETVPAFNPPMSGSLFLYDRRATRSYKRDGHNWAKKPIGGKRSAAKNNLKVAENSVKLRLPDGRFRVAGWYARSDGTAVGTTFRRRAYYLINPVDLRPDGDLVLVHYLDDAVAAPRARGVGGAAEVVGGGRLYGQSLPQHQPCNGEMMANATCEEIKTMVDPTAQQRIADFEGRSVQPRLAGDTVDDNGRLQQRPSAAFWCNEAPGVTDEDAAKEWEFFPEEEKARAIADIYGWDTEDGGGLVALHDSSASFERGPSGRAVGDILHRKGNEFTTELSHEIQSSRLALMDGEVKVMPPKMRADYEDAVRRCPQVGTARELKMQFFRCENDCAKAAARRMVNYWKKRVEIHGSDGAFFAPSLDGVMAGDCDDPTFGHARLLPGTDASGRGIIFVDTTIRGSSLTEERSLWYMAHAALEIDSVRDNGVIFVFYNTEEALEKFDYEDIDAKHHLIRDCLPVKVCAFHVCQFDRRTWFLSAVYAALRFMVGRFLRCRTVFHEGPSKERALLQLAEYGMSRNQLPTQIGGNYSNDDFKEWLAFRRESGR